MIMKIQVSYGKGIKIYNKSPLWMKDLFAICTMPVPRSIMLGSGFHDYFGKLNRTQWYKLEDLNKLQEKKLRALIKHAYFNVPYYHRIFNENNINYQDIRTLEDLEKLPLLTKDDIRNHFNELIAVNASDYMYGVGKTSGSTGKPLSFLLDQQNREMEYATVWRQLNWAGIKFNDKIATFRADLVDETGYKNILWKRNALSKELVFNTFDLNITKIKKIVDKLSKFKPHLIKAYPSTLYVIALYMDEHATEKIVEPVAIQTSSELLSKKQRHIIQEQFNCQIFDWYGHSEYAVSAGECEKHDGYHINIESGILEFLNKSEHVSSGELGEITATGLYNYSMPLIRYRTSDIGSYTDEKCDCGRELPIMNSLEGRMSDMIVAPNGKVISGVAFEAYWEHRIGPYVPHVECLNIIQRAKSKILLKMVKNENYCEKETEFILNELSLLLGNDMEIDIKEVDSIPSSGKWRFTRSELSNDLF